MTKTNNKNILGSINILYIIVGAFLLISILFLLAFQVHLFRIRPYLCQYSEEEIINTSQLIDLPYKFDDISSIKYEGTGSILLLSESHGFSKMSNDDIFESICGLHGFLIINQENNWNHDGTIIITNEGQSYKYRIIIRRQLALIRRKI